VDTVCVAPHEQSGSQRREQESERLENDHILLRDRDDRPVLSCRDRAAEGLERNDQERRAKHENDIGGKERQRERENVTSRMNHDPQPDRSQDSTAPQDP
jgi:hypothetical protein